MFEEPIAQAEKKALQNRSMVMHSSLFGYSYELLTHAPLYTQWKSFLAYLRRFRAIAFTLKLFTVILSILETGALVILSTVIFLIILPVLIAFMLGILLTALLESKRTNRMMQAALKGQQVYVLFMRDSSENTFLNKNARDLAQRGTVLIISPYWICAQGLYPHGFYCTVRREAPRIFLVRRYYFFSLRRHVLKDTETAYLY